MEGNTIGNYRITKKIGEGGMGSVYLARDLTLEREVVIKIISPGLARDPGLMGRFRVEAIAQARLNHTNIVTIHSFDQEKETYYIVMEYVEGKTLKGIIKEEGKIGIKRALKILSSILEGLSYAHSMGVLHRDIKPANIFITHDDIVKIGDFGIAKVEGIEGLTRVGSALGTPLYSSPEQIRGEKMGAATDIYSLGITFYEMLTGSPPFSSSTGSNFEIQRGHLERSPRKPSLLNTAVPASVDALVMKSLAKSPQARFADAKAFKKAVDKLAGTAKKNKKEKASAGIKPFLEKLSLPKIKVPAADFSPLKSKLNLKEMKPFKRFFKLQGGSISAKNFDKRKLLYILIPLLILLLMVIAYSDNGVEKNPGKRYIKNEIKICRQVAAAPRITKENFLLKKNPPLCPGVLAVKNRRTK